MHVTLIDESRTIDVDASVDGDTIRVPADALGWELKPEGLCRGEICIPVRDSTSLVGPGGLDLAGVARLLRRPLAVDVAERVAVLGAPAGERAARLASLRAPDFALPDLTGTLHSLADQRGKKTLLIAWVSW